MVFADAWVSVRLLRGQRAGVHLSRRGGDALPTAAERAIAGPHRRARGGAAGRLREAGGDPRRGAVGGGAGAGGGGAGAAAGALSGDAADVQRGHGGGGGAGALPGGAGGRRGETAEGSGR